MWTFMFLIWGRILCAQKRESLTACRIIARSVHGTIWIGFLGSGLSLSDSPRTDTQESENDQDSLGGSIQ